jgi:hypothetical protein
MKNYVAVFAIFIVFFLLLPSADAQQVQPRPMPEQIVGRIGSADMRHFAPPELKAATELIVFPARKYDDARVLFREEMQKNPSDRFSYMALCQIDPPFRDAEYTHWRKTSISDKDDLFKKAASSYFHCLPYVVQDERFPQRTYGGEPARFYADRERGPLALLLKCWRDDPALETGILVAAIRSDLLYAPKVEENFLFTLIGLATDSQTASVYQVAKEKNWNVPIPDVTELGKEKAGRLVAAISNDISRLGVGRSGKDIPPNQIIGFDGKVKAIYSDSEHLWIFVQKHTEVWFLSEWRRRLKKQYDLP